MKQAEFYKNKYPLEDLLPTPNENEVQALVNECDYTAECDLISNTDFPNEPRYKVNRADAAFFFAMGYNAAKEIIENKLKPLNCGQNLYSVLNLLTYYLWYQFILITIGIINSIVNPSLQYVYATIKNIKSTKNIISMC